MGFSCLKATAISRRQFTFYHSVPRKSWYSCYWKAIGKHVIEKLYLSLVVITREHVGTQSTQGTLTREHVKHEHVIMWARRHARHIGTWAREHARHVDTWARKHARYVGSWAGKHARHVGTRARKDARYVATRARKARNLPDSVCSLLKGQFHNTNIAKSFFNIIRVFERIWHRRNK